RGVPAPPRKTFTQLIMRIWYKRLGAIVCVGPGASIALFGRVSCTPFEELLDATLECRSWQHHFAIAGQTADADLGAESHHAPGIAAARVRLAHLDNVAEVEV